MPAQFRLSRRVFESGCIVRGLAPEVSLCVVPAGRDGVATAARVRIGGPRGHRLEPHSERDISRNEAKLRVRDAYSLLVPPLQEQGLSEAHAAPAKNA